MIKELQRILKSRMLLATLIAVVILPLIYGGLYLWAFWDPYGKMENLPVAIVNEDLCARKETDNKQDEYCFGNELTETLSEEKNMDWQFVDRQTAMDGLRNRKYYTMAIIPKDFSESILSVDGDNPKQAKIEFQSRQATSFMAAKFTDTAFVKIKAALNEKIDKEYFDNIFSETRDSIKDLQKAVDGASDLADGLKEAVDGSDDLYDGVDKANSGAVDLRNGLKTLHEGGEKLSVGSSLAVLGVDQLTVGADDYVLQLKTAVGSLSGGQGMVIAEINKYLQSNPEATMSADLMTALAAAGQVNDGLNQLNLGVAGGGISLKNGLAALRIGVSDVATGSASLRDGLSTAVDGSSDLIEGLEEIKDGQKDLGDGLNEAYDGSVELRDKLQESVDKNISKTDKDKNEVQAAVMSAPVDIHDVSIDIVNNNGTGFAPYFIPLALWVGGMAIFFLVDLELDDKKRWRSFLAKLSMSLIVSLIQVLTLEAVLIKILGLKVNYGWQFAGFGMLLGMCFTLIQLFLTLVFGLPGKFIGIVLLMLQLTSSAGSYPIETAPEFFQKIGPFLPMTYAVSAFRELISGDNLATVESDSKMIIEFLGVVLILIFGYLLIKSKKKWKSLIKKRK